MTKISEQAESSNAIKPMLCEGSNIKIDYSKFKTYDFRKDDYNVMSLSGGRSSAYTLMMLLNGGFNTKNNNHIISFQNTGAEDETCYKFLYDIEQITGQKIHWLEYTLTKKFVDELVFSSFSYEKFCNNEYNHIGEILNIPKLIEFSKTWSKSQNNFWYKDGFSNKVESIKEVDYDTASRNGKPFIDVFLYKCAIRIMKREGLVLPNSHQRWCTGDMKEKVMTRWLSNNGIKEFTSYVGMRADEPIRVDRMFRKNDKNKKIQFDCPMYWESVFKSDVLKAWKDQPIDLGLFGETNSFRDFIGNCIFCHLKSRIKKLYLLQNGYSSNLFKQIERLAFAYNGEYDCMALSHGSYESLEKEAHEIEKIPITKVLSDTEIEIHCFGCGTSD